MRAENFAGSDQVRLCSAQTLDVVRNGTIRGGEQYQLQCAECVTGSVTVSSDRTYGRS